MALKKQYNTWSHMTNIRFRNPRWLPIYLRSERFCEQFGVPYSFLDFDMQGLDDESTYSYQANTMLNKLTHNYPCNGISIFDMKYFTRQSLYVINMKRKMN